MHVRNKIADYIIFAHIFLKLNDKTIYVYWIAINYKIKKMSRLYYIKILNMQHNYIMYKNGTLFYTFFSFNLTFMNESIVRTAMVYINIGITRST